MKSKVKEMSSVSLGSVEGAVEDDGMISREDIVNELILRSQIRESIKKLKKSMLSEEVELRKVIRKLIIKEAKKDIKDNPHPSTAINFLEDLLKQILPGIETDYKTLTSNPEQRESFRAHIINAVENIISSEDVIRSVNEQLKINTKIKEPKDDVSTLDGKGDPSKFIDISDQTPEDGEEVDRFSIAGKDETGRNLAQQSFEQIEKSIEETYAMLSDPNDQKDFEDFLITNLKLYFDRWEEELQTIVSEPTTPEYEEEKNKKEELEVDKTQSEV